LKEKRREACLGIRSSEREKAEAESRRKGGRRLRNAI
jgi:hypothetical protein